MHATVVHGRYFLGGGMMRVGFGRVEEFYDNLWGAGQGL